MPIRIKFSESEAFDAEPIPSGIYPVVVIESEVVEDTPSGFPYIRVVLDVSEGEYKGRRLWYRMSVHPRAMGFTRRDLVTLGVLGSDDPSDQDVDLDERELIGATCFAEVTIEPYQGEMRNSVQALRSSQKAQATSKKAPTTTRRRIV